MARGKQKERITTEWEKTYFNMGGLATDPLTIVNEYLLKNGINTGEKIAKYVDNFWNNVQFINSLDICALCLIWWRDTSLTAARSSWFKHPNQHHSEYIFDKDNNKRLILRIRTNDMEGRQAGKYWANKPHVHITLGDIDPKDKCRVLKPISKHIPYEEIGIQGLYKVKIK